ncbi:MAG: hypothetical protein IKF78_11695 [Atopobiaceae bacterium]|nr:hypothetical protein [Atopobiaceae bacterium]
MFPKRPAATLVATLLCGSLAAPLAGCTSGSSSSSIVSSSAASSSETKPAQTAPPADGTYNIDVTTDSSMFRSETCTLTVKDGVYTATISLPGEGFSRLYFGSAQDAEKATEGVYDYRLNDEGKYTFDIPVRALDTELPIAAFGQRRNTWYDHTIVFHTPTQKAAENAADAASSSSAQANGSATNAQDSA